MNEFKEERKITYMIFCLREIRENLDFFRAISRFEKGKVDYLEDLGNLNFINMSSENSVIVSVHEDTVEIHFNQYHIRILRKNVNKRSTSFPNNIKRIDVIIWGKTDNLKDKKFEEFNLIAGLSMRLDMVFYQFEAECRGILACPYVEVHQTLKPIIEHLRRIIGFEFVG